MRKLSLVGGLLLALAAASSTMAAAPSVRPAVTAAPTVATVALTWKATYAKSPIAGTAYVTGTSTGTSNKLIVRATGVKSGATVTVLIFDVAGSKTHTIMMTTTKATLNASHQFVEGWYLNAAQRAAFKYAVNHRFPVYVRLIDGTVMATGRLNRI